MWGGGGCDLHQHEARGVEFTLSELVRQAALLVIILFSFSCFISMLGVTACISDIGISNALSRQLVPSFFVTFSFSSGHNILCSKVTGRTFVGCKVAMRNAPNVSVALHL